MANPTALIGNRYQLHEQLGAGGMGVVYRATDRLTGKIVALKRVSTPRNETAPQTGTAPPTEGDPTTATVRRIALAREFQVLASLRHPNVISVLDYGFDDERRPYFTMTLLDRPQTILQAGRRLSLEKKVDLLIQLLQALAYLHRRGILHRDLKPGNVLVERGARLRVLDFGLASPQEVADSVVAGTLTHLAPELLARGVPSQASDLYAVGMIAYELFTYRYPFDRSTITSLLDQILLQEPDFTPLLALRPNLTTPVAVPDDAADLVSDTARRPTPPDGVAALSESDDTLIMDIDPAKVAAAWRQENPDKPTADTELPSPLQAAPPRLIDVVQKLLRKRPEERYQDASSVIADLCLAIGQPVVAESDAQRESFLQSAQFVGRDAELSELTSALDAAVDGHGSAWLIGGESGIGKSRLMDELAIRALVQGVIVLRGQGVAGGGVPYQLWRDPLRRLILSSEPTDREASVLKELVPEIGTLLGRDVADAIELTGQSGRLRLFTVIVNLFQRQRAPLLMVLEDLHWARRSLDVLNRVIPETGEIPLLIVGSYRDDEKPNLPVLVPGMRLMKLERLTDAAIGELAVSMLGDAGRDPDVIALLQRETEGNVFFLVEVARALAEEAGQLSRVGQGSLPSSVFAGGVQRIIQRRLHRVPTHARRLLKLAAVVGRSIDLKLMRYLYHGNLEAWLTRCVNAAVLEVKDGDWRFTHDKLRETLLAGLGKDAPTLHRRAAEAIEAVYPTDKSRFALLAEHWEIAGNRLRAAQYNYLASLHFTSISLYSDAITVLEKALSLLGESGSPHLRVAIAIQLGIVHERRSDYAAARGILEPALKQAWDLGDKELQTRALLQLGMVAFRQGDGMAAQEYSEQSLELAQATGDRQSVADSVNILGNAAYTRGELDTARGYMEQSLTLRREIDDQAGMAISLNALGLIALAQRGYLAARNYLEQSLAIRREIGSRHGIADCLANLGFVSQSQGDYAEARRFYEQAMTIYQEIGNRGNAATIHNNLGYMAFLQGEFEQARGYEEQSLAIQREIGDRHGVAYTLNDLSHIALAQGDYPGARSFNAQSQALREEIGDRRGIASCLNSSGRIAYYSGDVKAAREAIQSSLAIRRAISDPSGIAESLSELGVTAALDGDHTAALDFYNQALEIAYQLEERYLIAQTRSREAFSQIATGAYETAQVGLKEALAIARQLGAAPLIRQIIVAYARLQLHAGRAQRAAELIGFVEGYPTGGRPWFRALRDEIEEALPPATFAAAVAHGREMSLHAAIVLATRTR